tara:strand:- start:2784 stop:4106 length:1323 start_codon:yes stop_codon:yes gene_type:complete
MLKTNHVYFFDAQEFEDIIVHYLGFAENALAKKALKMGLTQHPSNLELMLLQSEIFILDEKYKTAIDLLDYISEIDPLHEEVLLQRATIASKSGDHKNAITFLKDALEISDEPDEIWNLLGMEYLLAEDYENGIYYFRSCLRFNKEDYPSLYNLLYCFEQLDKNEEAIESLNEVLEHNPYCEVAWHQLGKIFSKLGKTKEALSAFEFAIISDDTFTGAYIEKGKVLEKIGRINESLENYEVAQNTTDPSAFIFQSIGRCHEKLGNDGLAQKFYLKSVHTEPANENSWEALINFHIEAQNFKKAKRYSESALEVNSDSFPLWKQSAVINQSLNLNKEAITSYQKVIDLGYFDLTLLINYIDLHINLDELKEALDVLQIAFKGYPNSEELKTRALGCKLLLEKEMKIKEKIDSAKLKKDDLELLFRLFPSLKHKKYKLFFLK